MFRHVLLQIHPYTGANRPLQEFVQEIRNGEVVLYEDITPAYVTALIFKLEGQARDHAYGRVFQTTDELINHLKN